MVSGTEARRLLDDDGFLQAWEALAEACPWTTAFQRPAYARAWFAVYGTRQDPLIVRVDDGHGGLAGLLVLSRNREAGSGARDDAIAHVGRNQAEYQAWVTTPAHAAAVPALALTALRQAHPTLARLRLGYLPNALTDEWIPAAEAAGITVDRQWHGRGLMRVGPGSSVEASLRKSANRSRLSRLQKLGPVTLEQVTTRDALEPLIDEIAVHCDLRQGARHDAMPFTDDPHKRAFLLALMEAPGIAHVTVLRAGPAVVAAHLGVTDRQALPLGTLTYSPLHGASSPGKLLLLLLGRELGAQGYEALDLTPGGDAYKERFATESDQVAMIDLWFDRAAARRTARRRAARGMLGRVGRSVAARWAVVAQAIDWIRRTRQTRSLAAMPAAALDDGARWLRHWWSAEAGCRILAHPLAPTVFPVEEAGVRVNAVADLLCYRVEDPTHLDRGAFLQQALERLERGCILFTRVEDGTLVHVAWLDPRARVIGQEGGHPMPLADQPAVLFGDYTTPSARKRGLQQASIRARLAFAATQTTAPYALISLVTGSHQSGRSIEQAGFVEVARTGHTVRFGRSRQWATWSGPLQPDRETGALRWQPRPEPSPAPSKPA